MYNAIWPRVCWCTDRMVLYVEYGYVILNKLHIMSRLMLLKDRPCGLVVRVPNYRSRGPGSIPSATSLSEKKWVWNKVHSAL
jgi:hypothetical protein